MPSAHTAVSYLYGNISEAVPASGSCPNNSYIVSSQSWLLGSSPVMLMVVYEQVRVQPVSHLLGVYLLPL